VATLVNEKQAAGSYDIEWHSNGMDLGIYLCELKFGQGRLVTKMSKINSFII